MRMLNIHIFLVNERIFEKYAKILDFRGVNI